MNILEQMAKQIEHNIINARPVTCSDPRMWPLVGVAEAARLTEQGVTYQDLLHEFLDFKIT